MYSSLDGHGRDTDYEKLEFKWTECDILPQELVEVLVEKLEQTPDDPNQYCFFFHI